MKEQDAAHSFEKTPIWYTKDQMYDWLIRENYSEQIAKELSGKWSEDLQGAFNKGYEKSVKELTRLRSELQQERELRKELCKGLESLDRLYYAGYTIYPKDLESLIKKAKQIN